MKILRTPDGRFLVGPVEHTFPYDPAPDAVWVDVQAYLPEVLAHLEAIQAPVEVKLQVQALPLGPRRLTKLEFLEKFTRDERIAMRSLRTYDPIVEDFLHLLDLAEFVDLQNPDVLAAIEYMLQKGILTPDRAMEIQR